MNKRGLEIPPLALEDLEKRLHFVSGEGRIAEYLYLIEDDLEALRKSCPIPKKQIFEKFKDVFCKK